MRSLLILLALCSITFAGTKVTLDNSGILVIDGHKTFLLSTSLPPMPGATDPHGNDGLKVLRDDGLTFVRIRPTSPHDWTEEGVRSIKPWLDAAADAHLYTWVTLGELTATNPKKPENERLLRLAINLYKDHPALGGWKGYDEPAWVKMPAEKLISARKIYRDLDPNHPVIIIQAPMKKSLPFRPYSDAADIFGVDIYPVAYPPGNHSDLPNKGISLVADWTKIIHDAMAPKPVWMTLQIATMVTLNPGKTLRYPTFFQQRYMAYACIINGARGVNWQGGERPLAFNERDTKLGWNWTYWEKIMRPLLAELNDKSPLHEALIAPDSKLPIKVEGDTGLEYCVRETGDEIFILAAKREGATVQMKFTGLPATEATGSVLYEEPRKIEIKNGEFQDWFGPNEVHVYRIKRKA